jgi:adenylyltransferase/sulfurtransferase
MLNEAELTRYDRQIRLPGFGKAGQAKLKSCRVLIAGAGGLGSPVAFYLAAAGTGHIRIVDDDTVELSNLNRQLLHWQEDLGELKARSGAAKLARLNPDISVEAVAETITEDSAARLAAGADIIVDATDNMATRYRLNQTALEMGIPFIHGAVGSFEGRVMTVLPGRSACLNCLYRGADVPRQKFPVIGVIPGIIGCIQATEVIKYIVGLGELLTDRLLSYDALGMTFTELKVKRDPECAHCAVKPNK